jgi:hypothetical protein
MMKKISYQKMLMSKDNNIYHTIHLSMKSQVTLNHHKSIKWQAISVKKDWLKLQAGESRMNHI